MIYPMDFAGKDYVTLEVIIDPTKIGVRTRNNVINILRGKKVAPRGGDAQMLAQMMVQRHHLPVLRVCKTKNGVELEYYDIPQEVADQINPFYQAERVAIRMDDSDYRHHSLSNGISNWSKECIPARGFNDAFSLVDCYEPLRAIADQYNSRFKGLVARAVTELNSNQIIKFSMENDNESV